MRLEIMLSTLYIVTSVVTYLLVEREMELQGNSMKERNEGPIKSFEHCERLRDMSLTLQWWSCTLNAHYFTQCSRETNTTTNNKEDSK